MKGFPYLIERYEVSDLGYKMGLKIYQGFQLHNADK